VSDRTIMLIDSVLQHITTAEEHKLLEECQEKLPEMYVSDMPNPPPPTQVKSELMLTDFEEYQIQLDKFNRDFDVYKSEMSVVKKFREERDFVIKKVTARIAVAEAKLELMVSERLNKEKEEKEKEKEEKVKEERERLNKEKEDKEKEEREKCVGSVGKSVGTPPVLTLPALFRFPLTSVNNANPLKGKEPVSVPTPAHTPSVVTGFKPTPSLVSAKKQVQKVAQEVVVIDDDDEEGNSQGTGGGVDDEGDEEDDIDWTKPIGTRVENRLARMSLFLNFLTKTLLGDMGTLDDVELTKELRLNGIGAIQWLSTKTMGGSRPTKKRKGDGKDGGGGKKPKK